jgi:hypothetical protein
MELPKEETRVALLSDDNNSDHRRDPIIKTEKRSLRVGRSIASSLLGMLLGVLVAEIVGNSMIEISRVIFFTIVRI